LYQSDTAPYDLGEYPAALDEYKQAFRLRPDPAFLFNIGQCYRKMNQPEEAALAYRSYLREAPEARNRAEVERAIEEMDRAAAAQRANKPPVGTEPPQAERPPPSAPPL